MARLPETIDYSEKVNNLQDELAGLKKQLADIVIATNQNIKRNEAAQLEALNEIYKQELKLELSRRELKAETATLNEQRQLEALQRIHKAEKELLEDYKAALDAHNINAEENPKAAARLKKRLAAEQAIEKTTRNAASYVERLPLIGKKLGERGNILDVFQRISSITDDVSGKIVNWKNAASVYGAGAAGARTKASARRIAGREAKEAGFEGEDLKQWKDLAVEDQQKAHGLAKDLKKAGRKAAKGDEQSIKLIEALDNLREAMENGDDAQKAEAKKQFQEARGEAGELSDKEFAAAEAQLAASEATKAGWANATAILANLAQKLEGKMDELALDKARVDTRLYGSNRNKQLFGSYWSRISQDMAATMISPFLKEETLLANIKKAVDMGISRDVAQFGMLDTIKDKIAQTFDAFDGSVLRLIKIQDETTTAARLGMESTLNKFLNNMYETTEYLKSLASQVRSSLVEAEALMDAQSAVDFEFQVQKWLGSLSSVGVSDSGISSIASALGQLAAGQVESITNGGVGNLLVMAANTGNLSIADILADGLDASETNVLLNQMVSYMHDLVVEANGNKVVQQQLAKVFGLTASDLKAATNLTWGSGSASGVYSNGGLMKQIFNTGTGDTYNAMLGELFSRADTMYQRTSVGEMLTNIWDNIQFATAAGMASNPAAYIAMKVADILDTFAGGIPIPSISVMGNGVDTKLTVSNIMKAASMVTGFTTSLIGAIGGMAKGGSGFGSGLLKLVGIENKVTRGASTSQSGTGMVYNASVEDTTESASQQGRDQAEQEKVSAKEESTDVTNETLNESILNIYNLLDDVVNGNSALRVNITDMQYMNNGLNFTSSIL